MDAKAPRDGRVIEELGSYDPMVPDSDARAILNGDRIAYWLSVGAIPTPKVGTLIKKYGKDGSHLQAQAEAISKLSARRAASITKARDAAISREMPVKEEPQPAPADEVTESTESGESSESTETVADGASEEATAEATES